MHQPILRSEISKGIPIIPAHATTIGSKPEMTLPVLKDRPHIIVREPVVCSEGGKSLPIISANPTICAEPEIPLAILEHCPHLIICQPVVCSEGGKRLPIISANPTICAEPEIPLAILQDFAYLHSCKAICYIVSAPVPFPTSQEHNLARSRRRRVETEVIPNPTAAQRCSKSRSQLKPHLLPR